jgi:hypothetical protein
MLKLSLSYVQAISNQCNEQDLSTHLFPSILSLVIVGKIATAAFEISCVILDIPSLGRR